MLRVELAGIVSMPLEPTRTIVNYPVNAAARRRQQTLSIIDYVDDKTANIKEVRTES